jgi:hypothetical protein
MRFRIGFLLLVAVALVSCSGEKTASTPSSPNKTERLPPEVTGDPASALPKQKARPRSP